MQNSENKITEKIEKFANFEKAAGFLILIFNLIFWENSKINFWGILAGIFFSDSFFKIAPTFLVAQKFEKKFAEIFDARTDSAAKILQKILKKIDEIVAKKNF